MKTTKNTKKKSDIVSTQVDSNIAKFVQVDISKVERGDIVHLEPDSNVDWLVLDVGNPYVMIENLQTHFAYCYHSTVFYKQSSK